MSWPNKKHQAVTTAYTLPVMSDQHHTGSTSMFGIFILTMYTIVLIPYTIAHACSSEDSAPVQPWTEKASDRLLASNRG